MSHCHISWDSYKTNIYKGFSRLQQREEFVDMTLAADGYVVKVHKTLMALASAYIGEMLLSASCQHPVIFLYNVSHDILAYLLDYIYMGEVYVPKEKIGAFLKTAKSLQITGIRDIIAPMCDPFANTKTQLIEKSEINMKRKRKVLFPTRSNTGNKQNILDANATALETQTNQIQVNLGSTDDAENMRSDSNHELGIEDIPPESNHEATINKSEFQYFTMNFEKHAHTSVEEPGAVELLKETPSNQGFETNNENSAISKECILNPELNTGIVAGSSNGPVKHIIIHGPADKNVDQELNETDSQNKDVYNQWKLNPVQNYTLEVQPTGIENSQLMNITHDNDTKNTETIESSNLLASTATTPLYTVSNRGSLQLILNRYVYNKHHTSNGGRKIRWRCIDYRVIHCQAYVDTDGDLIVSRKYNHCHPFHDKQILKKDQYMTQDAAEAAAKIN